MRVLTSALLRQGAGDQHLDLLVSDLPRCSGPGCVRQPVHPVLGEPHPPLTDRLPRYPGPGRDSRQRRHPALLRAGQRDPGPLGQACNAVRLRASAPRASRSSSDSSSRTSFGLGINQAYNLQTNLRLGTLDGRCVRVVETVYEFGQLVKGTPKSEASKRKITLPELIMPELQRHLDTYSAPGPDGFVFVGVKGGQLRRSNFSKPWARALAKAGLPDDLHVHDLRHTGNTLAEVSGVAAAASFGGSGERALRAVQRVALEQARSHGSPGTLRDLRCHHPLA